MVDEIVVRPPAGSLDELPSDDFTLVMPGAFMASPTSNAGRILVFDLGMTRIHGVSHWLDNATEAQLNATVIVLGTEEQLRQAQSPLANFDVAFIEKPEGLPDEQILQYLYDQLSAVYAPFRRQGVQFAPISPEGAETSAPDPGSAQQRLLAAIFGELADAVEPRVTEIDPAYSRPTELTRDEYEQFLAHLRQPESEESTDSD
jgi:hypothetical protein